MENSSLPQFVQLQRAAKTAKPTGKAYKLAILGNSSTQHLAIAIKGLACLCGLDLEVFDADYDQIDIQLLDPNSETYESNSNGVLIYMTPERIYEDYVETDEENRKTFAESYVQRIKNYWELINNYSKANILQSTIVEYDDGVFGSYGSKVESSFIFQLRKINYLITEAALGNPSVFIADFKELQNQIGRRNTTDPKMYYMAKISTSVEVLPDYAKCVVDVIASMVGRSKKCIILDLDNTLWGGVIGEDGLAGIKIGNLGSGHAFSDLQIWLKELRKRGILLAVCSKNDEEIAKEPFEKIGEMILRLDDFAIFVANWDNKVDNIRYIQQTLNIGMDSIVFLDDNPFERELVKENIPEITVPDLPKDAAKYLSYLQSINLFETVSFSAEDSKRTEQYQIEARRNAHKLKAASYEDYLKELDMECHWDYFDEQNTPRIAQLTQRSNQFNLRTIRYTEGQIKDIIDDKSRIGLYFCLKDKYGDYGLISVVILDIKQDKAVFIETWLMSCRVLKRGVEKFVLNKIVNVALNAGCAEVRGEYLPTRKNSMVAGLYDELGFVKTGEDTWKLELVGYKPESGYIKEV